jgi:dTDP-4-amino-4,6-dideoxygalactose transaminase
MGSVTEELEHRIGEALDVPYVVATSSGSIALLMSMMALGIKAGDEVIIPNRTWIATAHAPMILGAKPVLVDVLPDRPIMDTSLIREKINSKTKAIIPVQLCGCAVYMEEVWEIDKEYNLAVVEDTAQGLFSKYNGKYMGTQSDIGCFSMAVSKLVSSGQGGFAVTKDKELYEQMRLIRTHGVANVNAATPFVRMGFNFRYTDIHASIGLVQLDKVNNRIENLKYIYEKYKNGLSELNFLKLIPIDIENGEIPLYIEVLVENREKVVEYLLLNNIETRLFYPDLDSAIHLKSNYDFPNAHLFERQGLVLPCGH